MYSNIVKHRPPLTVGELRKALEGVCDDVKVRISSDSGFDEGEGEIIVVSAYYTKYEADNEIIEYFDIYANEYDEECEEY